MPNFKEMTPEEIHDFFKVQQARSEAMLADLRLENKIYKERIEVLDNVFDKFLSMIERCLNYNK